MKLLLPLLLLIAIGITHAAVAQTITTTDDFTRLTEDIANTIYKKSTDNPDLLATPRVPIVY